MPRTLVVSDGFTSASAPTGGLAGFTAVGVYASTSAYVTAKGSAAANGDCFINSADNLFYYYVGAAWQTAVLPASVQVLTNKDIDGGTASNTNRITIPKASLSTLQGLTRKEGTILYATDQEAFYLDDGTNLRPLGGASGGTGISFVTNGTFDINDDGVAVYADAAGATPVDGTGGSATLTAARTTTNPLRGDGSLLLTKDAANRQGEGASIAFTLARGYRNARQRISFAYEVKSGTFAAGSSSDLRVYVYDVTNGDLITPSQTTIDSQSGVFLATFDATDSESYRLIFHVATTSTAAFTIALDDIEVGPNQVVLGPAVSDWQEFTPTGSWNTNVVYTGFWRRVGDSMEVFAKVECDGGAPNSATLTINLPAGYQIDSAKLTGALNQREVFGRCYTTNVGTGAYYGNVVGDTATSMLPQWTDTSGPAASAFTSITQASPFTYGDADYVQVYFKVPIVGWKTNLITANNRSFRLAESYSMTRVTATPTKLGEYRAYTRTASTHTYGDDAPGTAPSLANGFRIYNKAWATTPTTGETQRMEIFVGKNKAVRLQAYQSAARTGYSDVTPGYSTSFANCLGLKQSYDPTTGVLDVTALINSGGTGTVGVGVSPTGSTLSDCYFDIEIADAPQIAFGLEGDIIVSARKAGANEAFTTKEQIIFDDEDIDTHSAYDNATGTFTAPRTGYYTFSALITLTGTSIGDELGLFLHKNDVEYRRLRYSYPTADGVTAAPFPMVNVYLNAGDTIKFLAQAETGSLTIDATNSNNWNWIEIRSKGI